MLKKSVLIGLGWLFVLLAVIGAFIPLLPSTPFLILAAACFSKSSPRFHQMLLNHRWFGPPLRQWETSKSMDPAVKKKVYLIIILSFSLSILLLWGRPVLQYLLVGIGLILLWFISRIKETPPAKTIDTL